MEKTERRCEQRTSGDDREMANRFDAREEVRQNSSPNRKRALGRKKESVKMWDGSEVWERNLLVHRLIPICLAAISFAYLTTTQRLSSVTHLTIRHYVYSNLFMNNKSTRPYRSTFGALFSRQYLRVFSQVRFFNPFPFSLTISILFPQGFSPPTSHRWKSSATPNPSINVTLVFPQNQRPVACRNQMCDHRTVLHIPPASPISSALFSSTAKLRNIPHGFI